MKTTPLKKKTLWISIGLAGLAIFCLTLGWFLVAALAGTLSALNLLAGAIMKGY